ncbi:MAG: DUF4279 domain-containing protein [Nitrospirae bacterium]|nr:DUF4279 domain-containing protein [Nitrospirota bacterium]
MKYDDKYTSCKRTYASLCIYPGEILPEEITKRLKTEPTEIVHKGDLDYKGRKRKLHGWFLRTQGVIKSRDSRRHIDWIIERIKNRKTEIKKLQSQGAEMYITCLWLPRGYGGGPTISPPQMAELSKLNIEVWWDIYCALENNE